MSMDAEARASPEASHSSERKRKREDPEGVELEIDVTLPEPPSKKALRKAKKGKLVSDTPSNLVKPEAEPTDNKEEIEDGAERTSDTKSSTRSEHGIWIGNLSWAMDKKALRAFFTQNSNIIEDQITRIHMPPPAKATATKTQVKPQNKGFAYVDFASSEAMETAIALSETAIGGRKVLIKNAKSFEGRPAKSKSSQTDGKGALDKQKQPSRKIFVGNLGFDVTKEDLSEHFKICGEVAEIHMATFEDSGKCKGFAWVTFSELDAAEAAVRGWAIMSPKDNEDTKHTEDSNSDDLVEQESRDKKPKKTKGRKWFVNRLSGRPLRCEFAEDPTTRYKKRFAKDPAQLNLTNDSINEEPTHSIADAGIDEFGRSERTRDNSHKSRLDTSSDPVKGRGKFGLESGPVYDNRKNKAVDESRYRTGVMIEGTGTKVTFD